MRPWPPVYLRACVLRYNAPISSTVVTFDVGQTLVELDLDFLAKRLGERGHEVAVASLGEALPAAWSTYDQLVQAGGRHPWHGFMSALLGGARVPEVDALVAWLWSEQPARNLWRRPIAPMVALARELRDAGIAVGVVSNSEGRLAELLADIAIDDAFGAIVDSGRLGIEKPDPRIFAHALAQLGVPAAANAFHIGDLYTPDVHGALGAGFRAIWYGKHVTPVDDPRVAVARDATETRAALVRWGVLS